MKKTAYIHIGLPKTGTTAIQTALRRLFKKGKLDKFDMQFHYRDTINPIQDFRCTGDERYFIDEIRKNIQKYSKIGEKSVIISNEAFAVSSHRGQFRFNYDLLPILAKIFKDYDIKAIIYIRRQDLFIESLAYQKVKEGQQATSYDVDIYYNELINKCLEFFRGGVIIRKYERESLYKSDAVSDFLHTIGLDELIDDYTKHKIKSANPSLSPHSFRIAMVNNEQYQLSDDERKAKVEEIENRYKNGFISRRRYRSLLYFYLHNLDMSESEESIKTQRKLLTENSSFSLGSSSQGFLSAEKRAEILSKYAEDNAIIARKYFGSEDGVLFNNKMPKNIVDINKEPNSSDIIKTLMPIIINLSQRCDRLERPAILRFFKYIKRKICEKY